MTDPNPADPNPGEGSTGVPSEPVQPAYAPPAPSYAPSPPPAPAPAAAMSAGAGAAAASAGGATAFVVADVPNRIIAYIIDILVLFVFGIAVAIVLGIIGLSAVSVSTAQTSINWFGSIVQTAVALAISAAYFVYSWTNQRATIGMKALGLQIGNEVAGATITTDAAIRRWLALGAAFSIAQLLNPLPLLGILIGLAAFAWFIFLLYSTWNSPTKQGWHDHFAHTKIVKATKSVV